MTDAVQFYLSSIAANAVDIDELKFRARDRVPDSRAETNWHRTGGRCRVTCRRPIAEILLEELRATVENATSQAVVDECRRAIVAVEEAVRQAEAPARRADRPDDERGLLGT